MLLLVFSSSSAARLPAMGAAGVPDAYAASLDEA